MRTITPKNARLIPQSANKVFQGKIFDVYQWPQKMFDGSYETFEMLKRPDTVQVIAVRDNKIVVLEEQQPNTKPYLSLPGGRHDHAQESEAEAAKREVAEETGLVFGEFKLLDVKQPQGKIEWFVYTFLATGLEREVGQKLDSGERVETRLVKFEEVKKLSQGLGGRYLAGEIFERVNSLVDLMELPAYQP